MATKTIKSSGGDYSSLSAFESNEQADLTGLGPMIAVCDGFVDTTGVLFSGWTTTASDYIGVISSVDGFHNGQSRDATGTGYQLAVNNASPIINNEDYFRIEGIELKRTGSAGTVLEMSGVNPASGANEVQVDRCIVQHRGTASSSQYMLRGKQANLVANVRNSVFYGTQQGADTRGGGVVVDSCTFFNGGTAAQGIVADSTSTYKNTYVGGWTSEDFWTGSTAPSGSHNASQDTSATTDYTNSITSITATNQFVNAAVSDTADFSLKVGHSLQQGSTALTEDILENSRSATHYIGAFVEAGGTTINANKDALSITEYSATIQADVDTNISANKDALVITEYQATIGVGTTINANKDALAITEYQATVQADVDTNISANKDALSITEYQATVQVGTTINANTDSLVLTEYSATVQADVDITIAANKDSLAITGYQAVVSSTVLPRIDGQSNQVLNTAGASLEVYFNGTDYFIID